MTSVSKKPLNRVLVITLLLLVGLIGASCKSNKTSTNQVLSVDDVAATPEKFKGEIVVTGTVVSRDASASRFGLGCEDARIMLPVQCTGQLPDSGRTVTVRGEIRKADAEHYLLVASQVTSK